MGDDALMVSLSSSFPYLSASVLACLITRRFGLTVPSSGRDRVGVSLPSPLHYVSTDQSFSGPLLPLYSQARCSFLRWLPRDDLLFFLPLGDVVPTFKLAGGTLGNVPSFIAVYGQDVSS